jgi:hypothetical protein
MGEQQVKNIARPVRVYRVLTAEKSAGATPERAQTAPAGEAPCGVYTRASAAKHWVPYARLTL